MLGVLLVKDALIKDLGNIERGKYPGLLVHIKPCRVTQQSLEQLKVLKFLATSHLLVMSVES